MSFTDLAIYIISACNVSYFKQHVHVSKQIRRDVRFLTMYEVRTAAASIADTVVRSTRRSDARQFAHGAAAGIEAEGEHGRLILVLFTRAHEALQILQVANRHGHVAARAADLEVEVVAVLLGASGQVELDAGEGELERDALVLHRAAALDRQRRRAHRHAHVHGGETFQRHGDYLLACDVTPRTRY